MQDIKKTLTYRQTYNNVINDGESFTVYSDTVERDAAITLLMVRMKHYQYRVEITIDSEATPGITIDLDDLRSNWGVEPWGSVQLRQIKYLQDSGNDIVVYEPDLPILYHQSITINAVSSKNNNQLEGVYIHKIYTPGADT